MKCDISYDWNKYNCEVIVGNFKDIVRAAPNSKSLSRAGYGVFGGSENLVSLAFWKKNKSIVCDGTACCGKTSCISTKAVVKVNQHLAIDVINVDAPAAVDYYFLNEKIETEGGNFGKDRSKFSNVSFLMTSTIMGSDAGLNVFKQINPVAYFAYMGGLAPILDYGKSKPGNILFVIDSNIESVQRRMRNRGFAIRSANDVFRAGSEEYPICQNLSYIAIAKFTGCPIIDIAKITIDEKHGIRVLKNLVASLVGYMGYNPGEEDIPWIPRGSDHMEPIKMVKDVLQTCQLSNR